MNSHLPPCTRESFSGCAFHAVSSLVQLRSCHLLINSKIIQLQTNLHFYGNYLYLPVGNEFQIVHAPRKIMHHNRCVFRMKKSKKISSCGWKQLTKGCFDIMCATVHSDRLGFIAKAASPPPPVRSPTGERQSLANPLRGCTTPPTR